MSEFQWNAAASPDQYEKLVEEVESKFIAAEDAMSELRHAVRQLKTYRPGTASSAPAMPPMPSLEETTAPEETAAPEATESLEAAVEAMPQPSKPRLDDETVGIPFWNGPAKAEPPPAPAPERPEPEVDSTSEGSWPIARRGEAPEPAIAPEPEAEPEPMAEVEPEPVSDAAVVEEEPVAETISAPEPIVEPAAKAADETRGEKAADALEEKRRSDAGSWATSSDFSWPGSKDPRREEAPKAEEAKSESAGWEPASEPAASNGDDEEARRDEVARLVAEMQAEGASEEPLEEAATDDDDVRRRDVARLVAEMRDQPPGADEPEAESAGADNGDDDIARRDEVARMVAEMRGEVSGAPAAEEVEESDDDARDRVARMVAQMRASGLQGDEDDASSDADDEAAQRESVADVVAQMRASLDDDADEAEHDEGPPESDDDVRDEVRRAVEAARSELAGGGAEGGKKGAFTEWQSSGAAPAGPPVIVIKDPEGKVELARVYDTLSRVNCDENAALLNYTPHSVTVGLNAASSVPEVDALTEAVTAAFGRSCEVDSDGVRVNVQIGQSGKGKHSAA